MNQGKSAQLKSNINDELRSEILAEFSALRSEMLRRIEMRQQILTFTLTIAGTLLAFGLQKNVILLIYPILALFLANLWTQHDNRIGEIAVYIRNEIEPLLEGVNWETYISRMYTGHKFRLVEFYALGLFWVVGILAVLLAWPGLTFTINEISLLFVDGIAIILTFISIRRRRKTFASKDKT